VIPGLRIDAHLGASREVELMMFRLAGSIV
jgi:hypothetical protein